MASGTRAAAQRSYEDFEPTTEWKREPSFDTLLVYLPGFRKEQMKVQVTSSRQLRIMGERPLGNNNKWSRFKKEIPIGSNYDTNEINARFDKGILFVKHPKVITQQQPQPQPQPAAASSQLPSQRPPQPRPAGPVVEAPKPIPPPPAAAPRPIPPPPPPPAAAPRPIPPPPPPAAAAQVSKPPPRRAQDQKPMATQPDHHPASNGKATATASSPPKETSIWKVPPTEPSVSRPPRAETKNPETGVEAKPDRISEEERKEKNGQRREPKADERKREEGDVSSSRVGRKSSSPLIPSAGKYKEAMNGLGKKVMEIREDPKRMMNLVFAVIAAVIILVYFRNAAKSLWKFKGGADIDDDQLLL